MMRGLVCVAVGAVSGLVLAAAIGFIVSEHFDSHLISV